MELFDMEILGITDEGLGHTSHLIGLGDGTALVVDPGRFPDGPMTVMCGHGERAMTAASLLATRGHALLTVLDGGPDDWHRTTGQALETGG